LRELEARYFYNLPNILAKLSAITEEDWTIVDSKLKHCEPFRDRIGRLIDPEPEIDFDSKQKIRSEICAMFASWIFNSNSGKESIDRSKWMRKFIVDRESLNHIPQEKLNDSEKEVYFYKLAALGTPTEIITATEQLGSSITESDLEKIVVSGATKEERRRLLIWGIGKFRDEIYGKDFLSFLIEDGLLGIIPFRMLGVHFHRRNTYRYSLDFIGN